MKQVKILLLVVFLSSFCACRKNLLTVPPTNLLNTQQAFGTVASVTAYFASMYRDLPIEDYGWVSGIFWTFPGNGNTYTMNWDDEAASSNNSSLNAGIFDDTYQAIRNVNTFIQLLPSQTQWDTPTQTAWLAEARFIRGYEYYFLAKCYGGVPLVLAPQATPTPLPRNTEVSVWNQVKADLDYAAANLPSNGQISATPAKLANSYTYGYGHANKWSAYALESRAMLFAACVGKYGDPSILTNTEAGAGICGVDLTSSGTYMQAAYDSANAVITGGVFSLYMKYPTDLAKNFEYLFYDCKQGDSNTEAIFCRGYDYATTQRTHSEDLMVLPDIIKSSTGYGNDLEPTLDFVESFENLDGSTDPLWADAPLTQLHYPTLTAPFLNKDYRLSGTIVLNGTQFRNSPAVGITGQRGVIIGTTAYTSGALNQYFDVTTHAFSSSVPTDPYVTGSGNSNNSTNPYWLKKWTDPVTDISLIHDYTSRTSWLEIRYGEVLLNFAEASFELGHANSESTNAINLLRTRAGLTSLGSVTLAQIRHERYVELGFEQKNYWDMVRWRTLVANFSNRTQYGLYVYWDVTTSDYVYEKEPSTTGKNYVAKAYYFDIPAKDLASDPLLTHNPGY